jgi:hypothetical protein
VHGMWTPHGIGRLPSVAEGCKGGRGGMVVAAVRLTFGRATVAVEVQGYPRDAVRCRGGMPASRTVVMAWTPEASSETRAKHVDRRFDGALMMSTRGGEV